MMLTKEKCEEALNSLYKVADKLVLDHNIFIGSYDILKKLIQVHFSNSPLKFDELNKGYPIYDNDEIVCGWKFIYMIDKEYKQLLLIDEEGNVNWVNYEKNRFYRKEVHG